MDVCPEEIEFSDCSFPVTCNHCADSGQGCGEGLGSGRALLYVSLFYLGNSVFLGDSLFHLVLSILLRRGIKQFLVPHPC